jgi:histone-lysine N-methyltransferase SETMAR
MIHQEFVPEGQTVNAEFYEAVLKRLLLRMQRVRPQMYEKWSLLNDNACPHTAICVRNFLAQRHVTVIEHPPYSPDLAPADFFLFPRLKGVLKGTHFADLPDIRRRVTSVL